jgi:hypothetical protein
MNIWMKLEFSRQIFGKKKSRIRFHQNPSSGCRVPVWRTDMTKLIVAFRNYSNAPKKGQLSLCSWAWCCCGSLLRPATSLPLLYCGHVEVQACSAIPLKNCQNDCPATNLRNLLLRSIRIYKVVQIWPGQNVTCLHTNNPGHIWTTLYHIWYIYILTTKTLIIRHY